MKWNWEEKDWPNLTFESGKIDAQESEFIRKSGELYGSLKHVNSEDQDSLKVDLISHEAFKTSEIEGELLNRDSLYSSIGRHFGINVENRRANPAEAGISDMMVDLYKNYQSPLDHQQLFYWHELLMQGRRDLIDIGAYRTHEEPMQIVSGAYGKQKVHYEAPPSNQVKSEMNTFITWFNQSFDKGSSIKPLARSGIAHLYFETIHPFEDGNGRIGRAISEKALSQALNRPTLIALSVLIEKDKKSYYDALQKYSIGLEVTGWLEYFSDLVLRAQDHTQSMIDFVIEKGKFFQKYGGVLNERQERVINRVFKEGIEGFKGGLSADNYIRIAGTTASTATRDLQNLVEIGALVKTGKLKGTRYHLNINHSSSGI